MDLAQHWQIFLLRWVVRMHNSEKTLRALRMLSCTWTLSQVALVGLSFPQKSFFLKRPISGFCLCLCLCHICLKLLCSALWFSLKSPKWLTHSMSVRLTMSPIEVSWKIKYLKRNCLSSPSLIFLGQTPLQLGISASLSAVNLSTSTSSSSSLLLWTGFAFWELFCL